MATCSSSQLQHIDDLILVVVNWLKKMIYYEPVKVSINVSALAEIIIKTIVRYHDLLNTIAGDRGSVFTSMFWSLLYYFLRIMRKLSTAFYLQIDSQTKKQNSNIKVYFQVFTNFEQDDWARLLPMAKFTYNNANNASTNHTLFELNYGYHPQASYKEDIHPQFQSKLAYKLASKLRELMTIYHKNIQHAQELPKKYHDKATKPRSYAPWDKVQLNHKYIKTMWNQKFETQFFGPFWGLYVADKQIYKIKLPRKQRIYDVYQLLLLKQDIIKKRQVNNNNTMTQLELDKKNSKDYKVEAIYNNMVYAKESKRVQLPSLYFLVSWKRYPKEENT